jgi:DNA mismatch repair protein MutL
MPIHVLDPTAAAQIAAGEVIERPASVIKEMVENALDAGAQRITIEARGGGLQEIKVQDDGCGIPADEVEVAFQRHATSKLQVADDLWRITTLGFRGEALPSIASIAQVVCITRTEEDEVGTELRVAGGEIQARLPRGCSRGTSMSVRNLFYNTPVRRDYLRSDTTEMGAISVVVQQYALAYPDVRFTLLLDGRLALQTSGNGDLRDVLIEIYGLDTARQLIPIEANYGTSTDAITIRGLVSPPGLTRSSKNAIHIFVNRRALQARGLLVHVLEEAYHTLLMKGKHPLAVLDIQVHPSAVDVNIHPTKSDVRFRHQSRVTSLIGRAVREALLEHAGVQAWSELLPSSPAEQVPHREVRQVGMDQQPQEPSSSAWGVGRGAWNVQYSRWDVGKPSGEDTASTTPTATPGTVSDTTAATMSAAHPSSPALPEGAAQEPGEGAAEVDAPIRSPSPSSPLTDGQDGQDDRGGLFSSEATASQEQARAGDAPDESPAAPSPTRTRQSGTNKLPLLRVVGQVGLTYLVAESPDGMYLIDQHAAHERIFYERLTEQHRAGTVESQELLMPQTVTLPPATVETLLANSETLATWGFMLEPWGDGMVRVRAVPAVLLQENLQTALQEIADSLSGEGGSTPDEWRETMLTTLACHTSVRAGQVLSLDEMRELLRQLEQCDNPLTCPHGRPIMILLTPGQLERQFGRAV